MKNGLFVVDFDDTMVRTDCRTKVTRKDGSVVFLTPAQYTTFSKADGDTFDFSEFETLRNPRPIQPTIRAMRRALLLGHAVVVCTARGKREPVFAFLRQQALWDVSVIALDSNDPQHKQDAVRGLLHGANRVTFFDDAIKNVKAVGALAGQYDGVRVKAKLVG
jgi:hypothetical protein